MKLKRNKSYNIKDYRKREVNLLPSNFHRIGRMKIIMTMTIALCIVVIGAFAYYEFSYYQEIKEIQHQTELKRNAISDNQKTINNQNVIVSIERRIAKKEFLLDYIYLSNRSLYDMIDKFEQTLNGEVYLTSLSADSSSKLVVSASAISHEAISYTINQLKHLVHEDGSKYFSDVFTQGIVRNEDENGSVLYLFQLTCEFEGGNFDEVQ